MSSKDKNKAHQGTTVRNTFFGVIMGLLMAIIGIQGYYTYLLSEKVDKLSSLKVNLLGFRNQDNNIAFSQVEGNQHQVKWDLDAWNPFKELHNIHDKMNQVFGDAFSRFSLSPNFNNILDENYFSPSVDVMAEGNRYIIKVDIPGTDPSNIKVKLVDAALHILAKTDKTKPDDNTRMLRSERFIGYFERQLSLPEAVDAHTLQKTYKNGVLTLTVSQDSTADSPTLP